MESTNWNARKPFDLRVRLFDFGVLTIRLVQFLHTRGPVAIALSYQFLKCGTSAGANYEEADDGSSPRDALAKKKIALREMKEARWRLRLLRRTGFLTSEHDPVIQESDELVRILSTIVRKAHRLAVARSPAKNLSG
jgi:four helix bundle protein